jgi:surfeit locus 1 family protein
MLSRLRQAKLIWPSLSALVAFVLLLGLGTWQVERKHWKENLLAKIAARVAADPVPLERAMAEMRAGGDVEYTHVSGVGRFLHDKERYLYAPTPTGLGWHVLTPLEIRPDRVVWVNRGLVPDASKTPSARPAGQIPGETTVAGVLRLQPQKTLFTPENDAARNIWYWADIPALSRSALPAGVTALPVTIEADANPAPPGGLPKGGVTRITLPNRHLEYAVTWYGLALTLIGVYLAFAINRLRSFPSG